eukprot:TRINITY_DN87957_c0_g1_i1.p1 TRINITY_DN87957_c0_g1~~TRINITY_DN87957_c0_g1_i1.p1  ORF type:complete len:160 (-),score=17.62 TRINITY_DN87957_c0_g1_i1:81-560(-)
MPMPRGVADSSLRQHFRSLPIRGLARLRFYDTVLQITKKGQERRRHRQAKASKRGSPASRDAAKTRHSDPAMEDTLRQLLDRCAPDLLNASSNRQELICRLGKELKLGSYAPSSQGAAPALSPEEKARRLELALRRCVDCRRGKVRVLRLRGPEDLSVV